MLVTAWKGGTYGIRVGLPNVRQYFRRSWRTIEVEIDSLNRTFRLSRTFWTTCPEFRGKVIGAWLTKNKLAPWPRGKPPQVELVPLGGNRFRLRKVKNQP